jgi:hypothetical protein
MIRITVFLGLLTFIAPQIQSTIMHITTSDAIDLAKIIARDEGYDVTNTRVYYFDLLITSKRKPLLQGYTSIGFYINGNIRSTVSINNGTGQSIDYNTCEVFEYSDVKPFQEQTTRLSKGTKKTPQQLADDAGCGSPKVLMKPDRSSTN